MRTVSAGATHGEMKRAIARQIGFDPERYSADIGAERHRRLIDMEITKICADLDLGFLADEPNQQRRDAIMVKIGRARGQMCAIGMHLIFERLSSPFRRASMSNSPNHDCICPIDEQPNEVAVELEGERGLVGIEKGTLSVSVVAPVYCTAGKLNDALEAVKETFNPFVDQVDVDKPGGKP